MLDKKEMTARELTDLVLNVTMTIILIAMTGNMVVCCFNAIPRLLELH